MSERIDHLQWEENFLSDWYTRTMHDEEEPIEALRANINFSDPTYLPQSVLHENVGTSSNEWFYNVRRQAAQEYSDVSDPIADTYKISEAQAQFVNDWLATSNQPRPTTAQASPYFEYMFADSNRVEEHSDFGSAQRQISTGLGVRQHGAYAYSGTHHNPIDLTLHSPVHHDLQPRYHIGGPISRDDVSVLKHSRFDPSTIPSNTHAIKTNDATRNISPSSRDFSFDKQEADQQYQATHGFFDRYKRQELSQPYRYPMIDGCLGFGNVRKGNRHDVAQPPLRLPQAELPYPGTSTILHAAEDVHVKYPLCHVQSTCHVQMEMSGTEEEVPTMPRVALKPKSRREKVNNIKRDAETGVGESVVKRRKKNTKDLVVDTVIASPVKETKKRLLKTSADNKAVRDSSSSDDSVQYLCTKKVRTEDHVQLPTPTVVPADICTPADYSILDSMVITDDESSITTTKLISNNNPFGYPTPEESPVEKAVHPPNEIEIERLRPPISPITPPPSTPPPTLPSPLTPTLHGFYGQFHGLSLSDLDPTNSLPHLPLTFGNPSHANSTYIQPNGTFTSHPSPDFTHANLAPADPLAHTLSRLHDTQADISSTSPIAMHRTLSQENLRREAHLEVTAARLEGVAVGMYRYYQGHLTVEEYIAKGLCVCWDACACSHLCGRVGDLICPCSGYIRPLKVTGIESKEV